MIIARNGKPRKDIGNPHLLHQYYSKLTTIPSLHKRPQSCFSSQLHVRKLSTSQKDCSKEIKPIFCSLKAGIFSSACTNGFPIRFTRRTCNLPKRLFFSMVSVHHSEGPEPRKYSKGEALNISSVNMSKPRKARCMSSIECKRNFNMTCTAAFRSLVPEKSKSSANRRTIKIRLPNAQYKTLM